MRYFIALAIACGTGIQCFGQVTQAVVLDPHNTNISIGGRKLVCNDVIKLVGNTPQTGEVGYWTLVNPSQAYFEGDTTNDTVIVHLISKDLIQAYWTISNGIEESPPATAYLNNQSPSKPNAGADIISCGTSHVLSANAATIGSGTWTTVYAGPSFNPHNKAINATVQNLVTGDNWLVWTISNSPTCASVYDKRDTVKVSNLGPSPAVVGADKSVCASNSTLQANTPAVGTTGKWKGPVGVVISNVDIPNPSVSSLTPGPNMFIWRTYIDSNHCVKRDTMVITASQSQTALVYGNVKKDTTLCNDRFLLVGNKPVSGSGQWSIAKGSGVFSNSTKDTTWVSNLGLGVDSITWTILNVSCPNSTASIKITNNTVTKPIVTKDSCFLNPFSSSLALRLKNNLKIGENGAWTVSRAPVPKTDINLQNNTVNHTAAFDTRGSGLYRFVYEATNAANCFSRDSSTYFLMRRAQLGNDTCVFLPTGSSTATVTIKAKTVPRISRLERGTWVSADGKLTSANAIVTTDSTFTFTAPRGSYLLNYGIRNDSCTKCSTLCPNTDQMLVTISAHAKIGTYTSCFLADQQNLTANTLATGETGKWTSPNGLFFPDSIKSTTLASNFKIGKSMAVWKIQHINGCVSSDTARFTRLTTPYAGKDTCFRSGISSLNYVVTGNALASGEQGQWNFGANSSSLNFSPIPNTTQGILQDSKNNGVYYLKWGVSAPGCPAFEDEVRISLVTNTRVPIDTFFTIPFATGITPTLTGNGGLLSSKERVQWFNNLNQPSTLGATSYVLPSLSAGKYNFVYTISDSLGLCRMSSTTQVIYLTKPHIKKSKPDTCVKSVNSLNLEANATVGTSGEQGIWYVDTTKYKNVIVQAQLAAPQKVTLFFNSPINNKYVVYWKTFSGRFSAKDSIVVTNLTKPIASGTICAKDTFVVLSPPASFPSLQSYEKASWARKPSSDQSLFKNDSLNNVLYNLKPGQISVATVISDKNSACADTSSYSLVTVVTKAKAFGSAYRCLTDSFTTLSANNYAVGETGQWSYKSSYSNTIPVFVNSSSSSSSIHGLGKRNTQLRWTIRNNLDATCSSADSLNTTLVVSTKAEVGYLDSCIVGVNSVNLRANKAQPYEKQAWLRAPSSDTISRNERITYSPVPLGVNTFTWVIYDSTYKACKSSAQQKATILAKPQILSATTCLVKPGSTVSDTLITQNDNGQPAVGYKWKSQFPTDLLNLVSSSNNQFKYVAVFSQAGKRILTWQDSASPSCISDTSISITVIPKAQASVSSTCLVDDALNIDTLKAKSVSSAEGIGRWSRIGPAKIADSSLAVTTAHLMDKGQTIFSWKISNGTCSDSANIAAILLSKAKLITDSCLFYSSTASVNAITIALSPNETASWSNNGLTYVSLGANTTKVSDFILGDNPVFWKISSQLDAKCADSVKVVYRTFTPSGFADRDTVFSCSKNISIGAKLPQSTSELVSWQLKPSQWKIKDPARQDSVQLTKLSNDTLYTLYRHIGKSGFCSLKDSILVKNRQVDTVWAIPQRIGANQTANTYYTCDNSFEIWTSNASSDINSAFGTWTNSVQAPGNTTLSIDPKSTASDKLVHNVTGMIGLGIYQLTWQVQNGLCPAKSVTLEFDKREGLSDIERVYDRDICGTEYRFDSVKIYKDADSVSWVSLTTGADIINPKVNDGQQVLFKNLQPEENRAVYTVYRSGCIGTTQIAIYRTDSNYTVSIGDSVLSYCEKDIDTLEAKYTLTRPNPRYFDMYWTNKLLSKDNQNLTPLPSGQDKILKSVVNIVQKNTPNKYYVYSKNGKCPIRADSVTVYNYSKPENIDASLTQDIVCGTTTKVNGKKPSIALGKWSFDDPNVIFTDSTDGSTKISNLKTREQPYTLTWSVTNGACFNEVSSLIRVADTISKAIVLFPATYPSINKACDSATLHLRSENPMYGKGMWILDNDSLSADLNYEYAVPAQVKSKIFKFIWKVSNDYCQKSDTAIVEYYKAPSPAVAGPTQSLVTDKTNLSATPPEVGKGTWSANKSNGVIADINNPGSEVSNLNFGENIFTWEVKNGDFCPVKRDLVVISFNDFTIPQGFSPNGDAKNDKFEVKGLEAYSGTELKVFNRWGREVFASMNYQNTWDGDGLEDDTYYYVMTLVNGRKYNGYVIIKRK